MRVTPILIAVFLLSTLALAGVTVKYSAPFSFPTTVSLESKQLAVPAPDFTCRHSLGGNPAFTWNIKGSSVPGLPAVRSSGRRGRITIYNILGKVVYSIPVDAPVGAAAWSLVKNPAPAGVYFARFNYGSVKRTAKLVIIN